MRKADILVEIDEIALHGIPPHDRHAVAAAFQAELERCFCEQGVPASLLAMGARERLDAGSISPTARAGLGLGGSVARALFGRFSRGDAPKGGTR
jgi:hypothetical protein